MPGRGQLAGAPAGPLLPIPTGAGLTAKVHPLLLVRLAGHASPRELRRLGKTQGSYIVILSKSDWERVKDLRFYFIFKIFYLFIIYKI